MKRKGNDEKETFRKTKEWKDFSKKIRSIGICACCGTHTKRLACHHMDESDYKNLDESKFVPLCSMCHKAVSRLERIKPENWAKYDKTWVDCYSRFLITK